MHGKPIKAIAAVSAGVIALVGCSGTGDADNKEYPSEAITFVIPYAPGGGTDIIFRAVLPYLEEELGQPVVPKNIPGASATNGSREVKGSDPDGYTLLGTHETIIDTYLAGVSNYSWESFEPVSLLTETPIIAAVGEQTGWESADDFVEAVQSNPGEIPWGGTTGSTSHFFIQQMLDELKLPADGINFINYVGTSDALTAIQTGEITGTYADAASAQSELESGTFKSIGVAYDERLDEFPKAKTFKEQGYDFTYTTARGVFAPEGTPPEVVERLSEAFEAAVNNPEFEEQLAGFGTLPSYLPHDEYAEFLERLEKDLTNVAKDMEF